MEFVAELESLRDFFGVEPQLEYPDASYRENCVTFEAELGDNSVCSSSCHRKVGRN